MTYFLIDTLLMLTAGGILAHAFGFPISKGVEVAFAASLLRLALPRWGVPK